MATLTVDLTQLPTRAREALHRTLSDEDAAKLALAKARQAAAKRFYDDHAGPAKAHVGPVDLIIDPYFASYFRRMYGERIFDDPEFIKYLKTRGEWFGVKERGTRVQVGYSGGNKRFSKTYTA